MPSGTWLAKWLAGDTLTAAELNKSIGAVFDSTLGVAAATIDTGAIIPAGYRHLLAVLVARTNSTNVWDLLQIRLNGTSTANYYSQVHFSSGTTMTAAESLAATTGVIGYADGATEATLSVCTIWIPNYATALNKFWKSEFFGSTNNSTGTLRTGQAGGFLAGLTAAVTRIEVLGAAGSLVAGSSLSVYVMGG